MLNKPSIGLDEALMITKKALVKFKHRQTKSIFKELEDQDVCHFLKGANVEALTKRRLLKKQQHY